MYGFYISRIIRYSRACVQYSGLLDKDTSTIGVPIKWETKRNEAKRNQRKRNETKRSETKRNQRNENEIKRNQRNQRKQNEIRC